jgi:hypothetical protein
LIRAAGFWAAFASLVAAGPGESTVVRVPAGADLQAAIDRAKPGDTLALEPGATYVGNFMLPATTGSQFITVATAPADGLPGAGQRVGPEHSRRLAKLRSPNRRPVLATRPGAHHWRLQLLELLPTQDGFGDIVTLGSGGAAQNDVSDVPHAIEIDRCYIHGDAAVGQKRGIALNSAGTVITGSYIAEIKAEGQDTQAIGGWNGPGPYRIENNYLEAAGENFLLGGSDPAIHGLIPTDVIVTRNHLAKPVSWRQGRWQVKNLFELKNARRVVVEHNVMEHAWAQAQSGYAVLLTPRNQDGAAPWATIEDVTFRHNVVRGAGGGVQITGEESDRRSGSSRRIRIVDNLFYDIDGGEWGGTGAFLLIGNGPSDIAVERNTVDQSGNILSAFGGSRAEPALIRSFVFRDNVVRHNAYGVHGADRAVGNDTLRAFFPGAVFEGNTIAGGDRRRYPSTNTFVTIGEFQRRLAEAVRAAEAGIAARMAGR